MTTRRLSYETLSHYMQRQNLCEKNLREAEVKKAIQNLVSAAFGEDTKIKKIFEENGKISIEIQ